jgi:peptidylprolyl isomerase
MTAANATPETLETILEMETSMGTLRIKLYNETPLHRDNFIKLVSENFFEDLLFHRVIKGFMVQAGDPDSKNAPANKMLGAGDPGYTIPAEFVYPQRFHKRGALSAARTGDEVNPRKESSGSQFYIVWGETYSEGKLNAMEQQMAKRAEQTLFNQLAAERKEEIMNFRRNRDQEGLMELQNELIALTKAQLAQSPKFQFTPEQREAYSQSGGTPHLDGEYTVFGEVIEGLEIVDKIQKVKTDRNDRPTEDVKILRIQRIQ